MSKNEETALVVPGAREAEHLPLVPITLVEFFVCPCGNHRFEVQHIEVWTSAGPWYCDICRQGWRFTRLPNGIQLTKHGEPLRRKLVKLAVAKQGVLILDTLDYGLEKNDAPLGEGDEYLYNQHQCPTNFLRLVERVIALCDEPGCKVTGDRWDLGDGKHGHADPHGFFAYVETLPWRDLDAEDPNVVTWPKGDDAIDVTPK